MPRKKTKQLPALEVGKYYEVRDETCWINGRGMRRNYQFHTLMVECLEKAVDDYLMPRVNRKLITKRNKNYMSSGHKFANEMIRRGLGGLEGEKHYTLRHRVYPKVKLHLSALSKCLDNKNKNRY